MKSMKAYIKEKRQMIQESRHSVKIQLIQMTIIKMQMIRFESVINAIQMKLTKVIPKMKGMTIQEFQLPFQFQVMMS
jgi:hypothetical protein